MKTNAHMAVLSHLPNMRSIVQKLTANLQTKWRENAVKSRRSDGKIADFRDLTEFVEHAAKAETTQFTVKKSSTAQEQHPTRRLLLRTKRSYHLIIPKA